MLGISQKIRAGAFQLLTKTHLSVFKQAREYDLLKAKYNALVEIWKHTEQEINNFN